MSSFSVKITNLPEIRKMFKKFPIAMTRELHVAVSRSVNVIERNVKREAPVNKQTGGGSLRQSVKGEMIGYSRGRVEVGVKYAMAVEKGTKPHIIRAKNKKVLANKRAKQVFGKVVHHPGTKPNPFFERGVKNSQGDVQKQFTRAVQRVINSKA